MNKIKFADLSIPLKILIVLGAVAEGWCVMYVLSWLIGFFKGLFGLSF